MTEPSWWRRRPGLRGVTRRITVDNVMWRVFEFLCPFDHPNDRTLVFVSDDAWHRVHTFPANWATCDDVALFAIGTGES